VCSSDLNNYVINIFPNPSGSTITIVIPDKLRNLINSTLIIYDITGRKVKTYSIDQKQNRLTIRTKEIGIGEFFVQLAAEGVIAAKEKIVIVK